MSREDFGDGKQSINTRLYFRKYDWTAFHSEKKLLLLEGRVSYEDDLSSVFFNMSMDFGLFL